MNIKCSLHDILHQLHISVHQAVDIVSHTAWLYWIYVFAYYAFASFVIVLMWVVCCYGQEPDNKNRLIFYCLVGLLLSLGLFIVHNAILATLYPKAWALHQLLQDMVM